MKYRDDEKKYIFRFRIFDFTFFKLIVFVFAFYVLCFMIQRSVSAAVLYLEPKSGEYRPGDTVIMDVRIDTEGECINTVKADIVFPKDILSVEDFSLEDSILTHWIQRPYTGDISKINKEGVVSFAGGIPGGYCGRILGDPNLSNVLAKIVFKIPSMIISKEAENLVEIKIKSDSSKVFLHDGLGTEASLSVQNARLVISDIAEAREDEWEEKLKKDNVPPEPFIVELQQTPAIFEGKYFIIFFTTDKQTGMDHFEVKEGDREFKIAQSPYVLEDQTLQSKILVKAVDKAGNERIVEFIPKAYKYLPPEEEVPVGKPYPWQTIIIIVVIIIGIGLVWIIIRKMRTTWKRKQERREEKNDKNQSLLLNKKELNIKENKRLEEINQDQESQDKN